MVIITQNIAVVKTKL